MRAAKKAAARHALEFVKKGMTLGLGSGSTAEIFIALLGRKIQDGLAVKGGVPTSERAAEAARRAGVPLLSLSECASVDLIVDGADEIDPDLNLVKGRGGALLLEKIVAFEAKRMIVIADQTKPVAALQGSPLPIEVPPFFTDKPPQQIADCLARHAKKKPVLALRKNDKGETRATDAGNLIYDCHMGGLDAPKILAEQLDRLPAIVEHGLFIGLADAVIIGEKDGTTRILKN